jgi:hypothetical protein
MMKLLFYWGPGDLVSNIIRVLTNGPYSHVEMQFTDGCRFFSSGHGIYKGVHMICDRKVYDEHWDQVLIPATEEQERAAERFIFHLIGFPFDLRAMIYFLVPFFERHKKARYCSAIVLNVLQESLGMFPGVNLKISPNGLHRLFVSEHAILVAPAVPDITPPSVTERVEPSGLKWSGLK